MMMIFWLVAVVVQEGLMLGVATAERVVEAVTPQGKVTEVEVVMEIMEQQQVSLVEQEVRHPEHHVKITMHQVIAMEMRPTTMQP